MKLSVVIVTHNRRERLLKTLRALPSRVVMPTSEWEVIVVDNGSEDATVEAVQGLQTTSSIHIIRRPRNEGVAARNHAIQASQGEYIMFLDDDAEPLGGCVHQSIGYLDEHRDCGAVGGRVELPDGSLEASALPAVPIHCGVIFRKQALVEIGLLPEDFRRQAEEYDVAFRMWNAGWRIERFEDLVYRHHKPAGHRPDALRWDARNNTVLAQRYLPPRLAKIYREDWSQRYLLMARYAGKPMAARLGMLAGRYACTGYDVSRPVSREAIEAILGFRRYEEQISGWSQEQGIRRVGLAGFGKNIFAVLRACRVSGLDVVGVLDDHPAFVGATYRGLPIVAKAHEMSRPLDAVVVAELNPARVEQLAASIEDSTGLPTLSLWSPQTLGASALLAAA